MSAERVTSTAALVEQMLDARAEDVPADARSAVRDALLDDVGVALLGSSLQAEPIVSWARDAGAGNPEAVLVGDGTRVSCAVAAGANAQFASGTNYNEAGPGQHIFSALAQTALAVGQRAGASGREIVTTVATAYQINGQLHLALRPQALEDGSGMRHIPLTVSLVAGRLLGLDATALNSAVGFAMFLLPLPTAEPAFWHEFWKRRGMFHVAMCTHGVNAALLAAHGLEGPQDVLDHDERYDHKALLTSPSPYHYPRRMMQLKLWQTSRGVHPGMQALLELVDEHDVGVDEIERITFRGPRLYLDAPFNNPAPTDLWAGVHSVQWALAMALLGYEPGRAWYAAERYEDPRCRALAARITLEEDTDADRATVETTVTAGKQAVTDTANEIVLSLRDGRRLSRRHSKGAAIGHPNAPLSTDQLHSKFLACAGPVLGDARARVLLDRLARVEEETELRGLAALAAGPAANG